MQVNPVTTEFKDVPNDERIEPVLSLDISKYLLARPGDRFTATLTGYISRDIVMDGEKHTVPHYVSVTKSLVSSDFFLSDDLNPTKPRNLGPKPTMSLVAYKRLASTIYIILLYWL